MEIFLMGAIAMASLVVAVFFLRFWRDTHDRLFAIFAAAFALLAVTRAGLAWSSTPQAVVAAPPSEAHTYWYLVRLAAFLLILVAIVDKNRR